LYGAAVDNTRGLACTPRDTLHPMHSFDRFFFAYFWFSHRSAAGEGSA